MLRPNELIVDNFAGGGGASLGIELALGRGPDIAINHDSAAIAMHATNHPGTQHFLGDVWDVDPIGACAGRPVGLGWFSPDCKHFSRAKGGKPVEKRIRALAWVVVRWARTARPRVICLENVEEFEDWGPLGPDNRPDPSRRSLTFRRWLGQLRALGYAVEYRTLRASDYGAPTSRKRLFLIARCDGQPIVWPKPTHGPGLLPFRTAAECIDWALPCPSIFERKRPLADKTLRRIARGIQRFVIDDAEPFIIPLTHAGDARVHGLGESMRTVTGAHRGELALVAPTMIQTGYGERPGQAPRVLDLQAPLGTVVNGQKHGLVVAFLAKHYGGHETRGAGMSSPVSTITATDHHALVTSHILKLRGSSQVGQEADAPLPTITAQGTHLSEVRVLLERFLPEKFGEDGVRVLGGQYVIGDIGMRMLQPRELFRAQGFPDSYKIELLHGEKPLSKTAQVRLCGNSVCPPLAQAIVEANMVRGLQVGIAG